MTIQVNDMIGSETFVSNRHIFFSVKKCDKTPFLLGCVKMVHGPLHDYTVLGLGKIC